MSYTIIDAISRNRVPKWGNAKKYIAIHYLGVVGQNHELSEDGCGAHYYIYWDGTIYQRCSHDAIVWAVGTAGYYTQKHATARNANTISIEMCCKCDGDSSSAEDKKWYFTAETQEACVWLVKKLMADLGIPAENVLRHYDIVNKTCPAPYVHNNKYKTSWTWDEFKNRLNEANTSAGGASDATTDSSTDKIWLGWTKRESGSAGFRQTNGDSGKAYGKYQFDYRYALVPFLQYCMDYSAEHYAGFEKFAAYGAGSAKLVSNSYLAEQWEYACDTHPEEFEALQDRYAYTTYYSEVRKYMYNLHGIILDNHSPALKGSAYSMAIRSGALSAAKKFEGCKEGVTTDATMMHVAYATYGIEDASRWTEAGQLGDALEALKTGTYTLIRMTGSLTGAADILPKTEEPWYRVRKSWEDAGTQIGAYHDLEKAKACADSKAGYKVYDDSGNVVYEPAQSYTVQAGSFSKKENAEALVTKLKAAGFDAILKEENGQYKVQCGVFTKEGNATLLAARLKAAGFEAVIK